MELLKKVRILFSWIPKPKNYLFLRGSKKNALISKLADEKLHTEPKPVEKPAPPPMSPISPRIVKPSFFTFQDQVYHSIDKLQVTETGVNIFRDQGITENNKDFFYIKPNQGEGFLIERTDRGFIICKAKHIATRNLFVRSSQQFDQTLFVTAAKKGNLTLSREGLKDIFIKSTRYAGGQLAISVYVEKLLKDIMHSGAKLDWMQSEKLNPQESPEKNLRLEGFN